MRTRNRHTQRQSADCRFTFTNKRKQDKKRLVQMHPLFLLFGVWYACTGELFLFLFVKHHISCHRHSCAVHIIKRPAVLFCKRKIILHIFYYTFNIVHNGCRLNICTPIEAVGILKGFPVIGCRELFIEISCSLSIR